MRLTKNRICFVMAWVITGITSRFFPTYIFNIEALWKRIFVVLTIFILATLVNWVVIIITVALIDGYAEDAAHRIKNKVF